MTNSAKRSKRLFYRASRADKGTGSPKGTHAALVRDGRADGVISGRIVLLPAYEAGMTREEWKELGGRKTSYTIPEAARLLDVGRTTVRKMLFRKLLRPAPAKAGGARISAESIREMATANR